MSEKTGIVKGRPISIRWSIFKNLLLLILIFSSVLMLFLTLSARHSFKALLGRYLDEAAKRTELELTAYFDPIESEMLHLRDYARSGLYDPLDMESTCRFVKPVLLHDHRLAAFFSGSADGLGATISRENDGWLLRELVEGDAGGADREIWRWLDQDGSLLKEKTLEAGYDPRTRPWYQLAADEADNEVRWTNPYRFLKDGILGITAVVPVNAASEDKVVIAVDLFLDEVRQFINGIQVGENGFVVLATAGGEFIGDVHPDVLGSSGEAEIEIGDYLTHLALQDEKIQSGPAEKKFAGEDWWIDFEAFRLGGGTPLWVGVFVPESDLTGDRLQQQIVLLLVSAGVMGIAALLTMLLAKRYGEPLEKLVTFSDQLKALVTSEPLSVTSRIREVRQLAEAQESMRGALDSFARYVPIGVVRDLLQRDEAASIGGKATHVTVLFTDIEGFTGITEKMTSSDLMEHVSEYFEGIVSILDKHGATVDKFIGDAVMAFWGAPAEMEDASCHAVEAVLEILAWLDAANNRWEKNGLPRLPTRFGIAAGEVTVGNVGAIQRMSYTALGDPVNLAQRLEKLNNEFGTTVLADEQVFKEAGDRFSWKEVGEVTVRGKQKSVSVYELQQFRGKDA